MKGMLLYPKLSLQGIRKNKQLYLPYLLTCAAMTAIYYILSFLSLSPAISSVRGGNDAQMILTLGIGVIAVFAFIFLTYTNSFLIKRRRKEFGLYNILGMGKCNLLHIVLWDGFFSGVLSIAAGIVIGVLLSKGAELVVFNMINLKPDFAMDVSLPAAVSTIITFSVIFAFLTIKTAFGVRISNPIQLMRSETVGERPVKANWLLALLGVIILGAAYYMAVIIENPLIALSMFFIAVIMVIIATYLLFISGSTALCKLLQKNKNYYYKTNHFISVSSMAYRMKRNGAGLASICILSTMVLVMISSTACLYIGADDALRSRYARDIEVDITLGDVYNEADMPALVEKIDGILAEQGLTRLDALEYGRKSMAGLYKDGSITFSGAHDADTNTRYDSYAFIYVLDESGYVTLTGKNLALGENEVLVYSPDMKFETDELQIEGVGTRNISPEQTDSLEHVYMHMMQSYKTIYIFANQSDFKAIGDAYNTYAGDGYVAGHYYYIGFNLDCEDYVKFDVYNTMYALLRTPETVNKNGYYDLKVTGLVSERDYFYGMYGALFFLGILLGYVFIAGAVLIMYYKQIIEGYEDQSRFAILQKVGMTHSEIKKSINSQILTVFFLPLLAAGLHTGFAFPMVSKMLYLFEVYNLKLMLIVTVVSYLIFAVFYMLIYKSTSKAYYRIVSHA